MDEDSVLNSVKNYVGILSDYDVFDSQILSHINAAFSALFQLGIGKDQAFFVTDKSISWENLFSDYLNLIPMIKEYTFMKVKLLFDPPTSSIVLDQMTKLVSEFEFRINVQVEGGGFTNESLPSN